MNYAKVSFKNIIQLLHILEGYLLSHLYLEPGRIRLQDSASVRFLTLGESTSGIVTPSVYPELRKDRKSVTNEGERQTWILELVDFTKLFDRNFFLKSTRHETTNFQNSCPRRTLESPKGVPDRQTSRASVFLGRQYPITGYYVNTIQFPGHMWGPNAIH